MGKRSLFVLMLVLALMVATVVLATSGSTAGPPITATMTGPEEVPPGDPDGSGTAAFTLNQARGRVCFRLEVENIEPATAAHIHPGGPGEVGAPIVHLIPPTDGSSSGCTHDVDPAVIKSIRKNPGDFYVNVHNDEFPGGAVRGQLHY